MPMDWCATICWGGSAWMPMDCCHRSSPTLDTGRGPDAVVAHRDRDAADALSAASQCHASYASSAASGAIFSLSLAAVLPRALTAASICTGARSWASANFGKGPAPRALR